MKKGGTVIRVKGRFERMADGDGYALFSRYEGFIPAGQYRMVTADAQFREMPPGLVGHVCLTRMMAARGLVCAPLVIDGSDEGEVRLTLFNAGSAFFRIAEGECIGRVVFSLAIFPLVVLERE